VLASQFLRLAYQWVDALWVRGLGVEATAAVTSSVFVLWSVVSLHDIFGLGVTAYVSQLLGAGDRARAGRAVFLGLRGAAIIGVVCAVAGALLAHRIFGLMGADPQLVRTGGRYLTIVLAGAPFFMVALTCECVMRASGDTRTPLLIDLTAIGLNAVLAPFLIYGIGPFPRLEVAGAAIATVCAQVVMCALYLVLAIRGHRAFPFAVRAPGAPVRALGMARVGVPGALIGLMFSVVYIAFARSASRYGAAAMAVVGIASRIEALEFITSVAIGTAGAALVGQNLGAGRPDRAVSVIRTGNLWNLAVTVTLTVLFWTVPGMFLGLFSRDPGVLAAGVPYLRILALCLVLNGAEIVTAESIIGSGHTRTLSAIFTTFSLARIPLAFLIPAWTGTGVRGVAWVITVTCVVRALVILAWASRGTWKRGLKSVLQSAEPTVVAP